MFRKYYVGILCFSLSTARYFFVAEEQLEGEDENRRANNGNRVIENENVAEAGQGEVANRWWVIAKEIQMIVFGFISSLLPGFHNVD